MNTKKESTAKNQTAAAGGGRLLVRAVEVVRWSALTLIWRAGMIWEKPDRWGGGGLRQVAVIGGKCVALLAWGSAAYGLKERENCIGQPPAR